MQSNDGEILDILAGILDEGDSYRIPEDLMVALRKISLSEQDVSENGAVQLVFDPETAQFIYVLGDGLLVVTQSGEVIYYEDLVSMASSNVILSAHLPNGEMIPIEELFDEGAYASDIANIVSQIATESGDAPVLTSNSSTTDFADFGQEQFGGNLNTSGSLGGPQGGGTISGALLGSDDSGRGPSRPLESESRGSSEQEQFVTISVQQESSTVQNAGGQLDFPSGGGLKGAVYDTSSGLSRLSQIDNLIDGNEPSATFTGTNIQYSGGGNIGQFLGDDGAAGSGDMSASANTFAVQLDGYVYLEAGTHTFSVASDDGFRLRVGDETVTQFDGNRGTRTSSGDIEITEPGLYPIDIVYWENGGGQSLNVQLNGVTLGGNNVHPELPEGAVEQEDGRFLMPEPSVDVVIDIAAALTDRAPEGAELGVKLEGFPPGATASAGTFDESGALILRPEELGELTINVPNGTPDFALDTTAIVRVEGQPIRVVNGRIDVDVAELDDVASAPTLNVSLGAPSISEFAVDAGDTGTGLSGEVYDSASGLSRLNQIDSMIGSSDPSITFTSTEVNYSGGGNIGQFLGSDAASATGATGASAHTFAVKLTGYIKLEPGTNTFNVRTDDGFRLKVNGETVTQFDGNRGARTSTGTFETEDGGLYEVEIVYWENGGGQVLDVDLNGSQLGGNILYSSLPAGYVSNGDGGFEPAGTLVEYPLNIDAALTDTDGSETLSVTVNGLPDGAGLSAGTVNDDGSVTLTSDQLDGLMLQASGDLADFDLQVTATSTEEIGDDTSTTVSTIRIDLPESAPDGTDDADNLDFRNSPVADGDNDGILEAGDGNDVIQLDSAMANLGGVTTIDGGDGQDTVQGTSSDDVFDFASSATLTNVETIRGMDGNDTISGGSGDDTILGDSGNDVLSGGGGADRLSGGDGSDRLTGGDGGDTFVLGTGGIDIITDFDANGGDRLDFSDMIDLSGIDDIDNYLQIEENGGNTTISVNMAGSGEEADFQNVAVLEGAAGLSVNDLIGSQEQNGGEVV